MEITLAQISVRRAAIICNAGHELSSGNKLRKTGRCVIRINREAEWLRPERVLITRDLAWPGRARGTKGEEEEEEEERTGTGSSRDSLNPVER